MRSLVAPSATPFPPFREATVCLALSPFLFFRCLSQRKSIDGIQIKVGDLVIVNGQFGEVTKKTGLPWSSDWEVRVDDVLLPVQEMFVSSDFGEGNPRAER